MYYEELFKDIRYSLSLVSLSLWPCLSFPTCSSLQSVFALLLCYTCSHFILITFSLLLVFVPLVLCRIISCACE